MIAAALAKYLDDQGYGTYAEDAGGGTIFVEHEPPTPDELIAVQSTGGNPLPDATANPWDEPTCQVLVRGAPHDPRSPYEAARAVYGDLQGLSHVTLDPGGTDEVRLLLARSLQTEPYHLGVDENDRHRYVINVALHVTAETTHRS